MIYMYTLKDFPNCEFDATHLRITLKLKKILIISQTAWQKQTSSNAFASTKNTLTIYVKTSKTPITCYLFCQVKDPRFVDICTPATDILLLTTCQSVYIVSYSHWLYRYYSYTYTTNTRQLFAKTTEQSSNKIHIIQSKDRSDKFEHFKVRFLY